MIALLTGNLIPTDTDNGQASPYAVIDVGGVGYGVFVTDNTLAELQRQQQQKSEVQVFIETHVREDHIHLFGFATAADRSAFRLLSTVQGVGAKVAMAILQELPADKLYTALLAQDTAAFTRAAGVGKKLATRIIAELPSPSPLSPPSPSSSNDNTSGGSDIRHDSLSALTNLGYDKSQAYQAVETILKNHDDISTAECIRLALQRLAA